MKTIGKTWTFGLIGGHVQSFYHVVEVREDDTHVTLIMTNGDVATITKPWLWLWTHAEN